MGWLTKILKGSSHKISEEHFHCDHNDDEVTWEAARVSRVMTIVYVYPCHFDSLIAWDCWCCPIMNTGLIRFWQRRNWQSNRAFHCWGRWERKESYRWAMRSSEYGNSCSCDIFRLFFHQVQENGMCIYIDGLVMYPFSWLLDTDSQLEEDELLAKALQESFNLESPPPQHEHESLFAPFQFLDPSRYRSMSHIPKVYYANPNVVHQHYWKIYTHLVQIRIWLMQNSNY